MSFLLWSGLRRSLLLRGVKENLISPLPCGSLAR